MHIFDVLTHVFSFMAVIKYPQYILQIHMDAHTYTHTHKDTYETSTANVDALTQCTEEHSIIHTSSV